MESVDKTLSPQQIANAAAYYSSLEVHLLPAPEPGDATLQARGQALAAHGDESKQLQACSSCHGPNGMGLPPAIPPLRANRPIT